MKYPASMIGNFEFIENEFFNKNPVEKKISARTLSLLISW